MADGKVWTASELLEMTPDERCEIIRAGLITDIEEVPPALLEQARHDIGAHIAASELET